MGFFGFKPRESKKPRTSRGSGPNIHRVPVDISSAVSIHSLGQTGLVFPSRSVLEPVSFGAQAEVTTKEATLPPPSVDLSPQPAWTPIHPPQVPGRNRFRELPPRLEIDGCSLSSPEDLPLHWRLILPALQVSLQTEWSNELDFPEGCRPYPYQWEGVKALADSSGFLLADDMGTGKTIQTLLAARLLFQKGIVKRMLVVAPISVLPQWQCESARWAKLLLVDLVRGTPKDRYTKWQNPSHVKLTAYETLRQDVDWLAKNKLLQFDLVVLDEAQRIKNPGTATAQSVKRAEAERRWGLTGTPLENRLDEVRAICSYIRPGLLKNANMTPQTVKRLIEPHLLRRRKEEVLKDLPAKQEFEVWLQMGPAQQSAYTEMEKKHVLELSKRDVITANHILTLILELKKICNRDPRSGDSIKGKWLRENLQDITGAGHKTLIFSQFRQPQFGGSEWIQDQLREYNPINYSEAKSDSLRQKFLEAFQTDPDRKVFVGHPRTAGLGLNQLVAANYVVHFDHWWNPAVTNQATARAHRPGQDREVFVYHLWVESTIEEMILGKLKHKQALFDETIDSLATLTSEDILFEVYEELLKKYNIRPAASPQEKQLEKGPGADGAPGETMESKHE